MLAKGIDIPNVTLLVIAADGLLHRPDISAEKIITVVATSGKSR